MREVRLRVGESTHHSLEGFGSAGYLWDFTIEQDVPAIRVERVSPVAPMMKRTRPESYSVREVYHVVAILPGEATVTFLLRRPWEDEKTATAANEETLKVLVSA